MNLVSIKERKNDIKVEIFKNDELLKKLILAVGKEYLVSPVNPQKLKHRRRKVIFKGFEKDRYGRMAIVQFTDTKRVGKVDFEDLEYINLDKCSRLL